MSIRAKKPATDLRNHGVAVKNGSCLSVRAWRDPESGRDYIYCGITSTSSLVVQVDVKTGRCRDFRLPSPCGGPWGIDFTLDGDLLVTSTSGHLARINPRTGKTWITADCGHWLWTIDRGADGKFYLGSSSDCRLFRYDAATEGLEDLGQMHPTEKYLRGVVDGDDGYLYCSVGCTAAQVVAYHLASGRATVLLPKFEEAPNFHTVTRGMDGRLYVITVKGNVYRLVHGQAFPTANDRAAREARDRLYRGYRESLPDGRSITYLDPDALRLGEGEDATILQMTYNTDGANIFHLAEGPHQTVVASTIMPLFILRYTPASDTLENLGRGGIDNGEAYSFGHCDGKLYYACYSYGNLMRYDPAQPWHTDLPGAMRWQDNPRLLTNLCTGHNRPRAMCVDSRKRVWIGSIPEYGLFHGGLGCYDTASETYENNPIVIRHQSIIALTPDDTGDTVYGGTSIGRGSGTDPVTTDAHLFAWDTAARKRRWKVVLPGVTGVLNLLHRDGKLYGSTGSNFSVFRFDVKRKAMDYLVPSDISAVREQSLCWGPDGNLYGITWVSFFRWRPETGQMEVLYSSAGARNAHSPGGSLFHRGAVIIGDRYYFSCGPRVMSLKVPLE
jgi:streptogramin lyase